jgi:hypothetical protein
LNLKYFIIQVVGVYCIIGFFLGIPILTNGGYHLFNLINDYSAYYGLLLLAFAFSIAVHFVYGFVSVKFRFMNDIKEMIGELNVVAKYYLMSMWYVGTPVMLLYIIVNAFIGMSSMADGYRSSYGSDADLIYPPWTTAIAYIMSFCPFIPIVLWLIYSVVRYGKDSFQPAPEWKAAGTAKHARNVIEPASEPKENPAYNGEESANL